METQTETTMALPSSTQQPNWLGLPPKAIELIIQNIAVSVGDLIRFKAVCCLWCRAANSFISSSSYSPAPWLLLPTNLSDTAGSCNFFSPEDQKIYRFNNMFRNHPPLAVLGSSQGWLVLYHHTFNNPCLFNPCSRLKILLPPLDVYVDIDNVVFPCPISKAILLSDPSTTKNWRVVVSFTSGLAIYVHNITSKWTQFGCLNKYQDILWHNDKLYALSLTYGGSVEVWDFENYHSPTKVASLLCILNHLPTNIKILTKLYYLVESMEDVLLVIQAIVDMPPNNHKHQLHFYVYKLDYSGEDWEKLESLGDRILFLNRDGSSISISARNCLNLEGNSIYFLTSTSMPEVKVKSETIIYSSLSRPDETLNAGVYKLEEKVAKRFPQPIDLFVTNANTCWIVPNPIKPSQLMIADIEVEPTPRARLGLGPRSTSKAILSQCFLYSAALVIVIYTFRSKPSYSSN